MKPYIKNLGKVKPTTEGIYDPNKCYLELSIVEFNLGGYISRKYVPSGIYPTNKEYWQKLGKDDDNNFILDEEDLTYDSTNDANFVKFKNRDTSKGLGYIILRTNKSLFEQMVQENTIYEIRYDFDLNGSTIEVPKGCVLEFQGGSFRNGSIKFNYTTINAGVYQIFDLGDLDSNGDTVYNLTGNITNECIYAEWFSDDTNPVKQLQTAINTSNNLKLSIKLLTKTYEIDRTIYLPAYIDMQGTANSEIRFTCRYLFRPKILSGQTEEQRWNNTISIYINRFTIKGVYSTPYFPKTGNMAEHAVQPYNGDPYWVRKTYVFYGGKYSGRIERITTRYVGVFMYGTVRATSKIVNCSLNVYRFAFTGMKAVEQNGVYDTTQRLYIGSSDEVEIGSTTSCTYNGKTFVGYQEEFYAPSAIFTALVDGQISGCYINAGILRPIAFYNCTMAHYTIKDNFIDFFYVVFYDSIRYDGGIEIITNNIMDYCYHIQVGVLTDVRFTDNFIYNNHNKYLYGAEAMNLYVYPYNDVYVEGEYYKLIRYHPATTFLPRAGWYGWRNTQILNNTFKNGNRFWYYVENVLRTKDFIIKDNAVHRYESIWPQITVGFQVYTGDNNPVEGDCTNIHVQFWEYREYEKWQAFLPLHIRPTDTSGNFQLYNNTSTVLDKTSGIKYTVIGDKFIPINVAITDVQYGSTVLMPPNTDGALFYNKYNNQLGFHHPTESGYYIGHLSDGSTAWGKFGKDFPNTELLNEGFTFYSTKLKKMVLWNGEVWTNLDGTSLEEEQAKE